MLTFIDFYVLTYHILNYKQVVVDSTHNMLMG